MSALLDVPLLDQLKPGEAVLVDWAAERYHIDPHTISRSQLEDLRTSPAYFYARHVARTRPHSTSSAMELGTLVHLCLLEPHEWARRLYWPEPARPSKADGRKKPDSPERKVYDEWQAALKFWRESMPADALVLDADERERVEAMAGALRQHPEVADYLEMPGYNEQTVLWRHPKLDVVCRVRLDRLVFFDAETVINLDIKTSKGRGVTSFGLSIARYGYHRQGALYLDALAALYPDAREQHMVFGVVCSEAPHEAACFELDPDAIEVGRRQYEQTLAEYVRRRDESDWTAEWQRTVVGITMPGWAYKEE